MAVIDALWLEDVLSLSCQNGGVCSVPIYVRCCVAPENVCPFTSTSHLLLYDLLHLLCWITVIVWLRSGVFREAAHARARVCVCVGVICESAVTCCVSLWIRGETRQLFSLPLGQSLSSESEKLSSQHTLPRLPIKYIYIWNKDRFGADNKSDKNVKDN